MTDLVSVVRLVVRLVPVLFLVFGPLIVVTLLIRSSDGPVDRRERITAAGLITLVAVLAGPRLVGSGTCSGGTFCEVDTAVREGLNLLANLTIGGLSFIAATTVPDTGAIADADAVRARALIAAGLAFAALLTALLMMLVSSPILLPAEGAFARRCGAGLVCRLRLLVGGLFMNVLLLVLVFVGPFVVATVLALLRKR